ncbi:hypothetical protein IFM89_023075 [Coptis chinensis]|uniref:ATPase AAA-type core domain-containing protein n=1 Tax=Coptis chinensis TaxID=261450 RepID=A0A835M6B4_9MAGN|nr:hypothetical protein IFM89_023075 [Coptis chinensis]
MRKIKNDFMIHWDGLLAKPSEQILVLAATNRPFDLEGAIIRWFERRIMVGLPFSENREKIPETLFCRKEKVKGVDFKELATVIEGYHGSDLRVRMREKKTRELRRNGELRRGFKYTRQEKGHRNFPRALKHRRYEGAKNRVAASFAAEGSIMSDWDLKFHKGKASFRGVQVDGISNLQCNTTFSRHELKFHEGKAERLEQVTAWSRKLEDVEKVQKDITSHMRSILVD